LQRLRTCERDGCENQLDEMHGGARYCSNACKTAAWRDRTGYRLLGVRKPSQTRKSRRSGRQISYRKAVEVLAAHLAAEEFHWCESDDEWYAVAEAWLHDALPERQR
jgi:hypothetical protein